MSRAAILQTSTGIDPATNGDGLVAAIGAAAAGGAAMLFTPEMSALLDRDRARAAPHIVAEDADPTLARVREAAAKAGIWVHVGSIAVRRGGDALANRGFVIDADGAVRARYDKLHMFDVDLPTGESWRESAAYRAGDRAVVVATPLGMLGVTICYDLRFAALYRALAEAGAELLAIPAAFTRPTGAAHWETLLRARAIETGSFVLAAAQTGEHQDGRATWGHSLAISPWGEVRLDMGEAPGLAFVDIDPAEVADARARIPVARHGRPIPAVERA